MDKAPKILRESKAQETGNQQSFDKDDPESLMRRSQNIPQCSKIQELIPLNSSSLHEADSTWFTEILSTPSCLKSFLSKERPNLYKSLMIRLYNSLKKFPDISGKSSNISELFKRVLERFLQNEKHSNPSFNISVLIDNKPFIRSLIALTLEIYMLLHDDTSIQFKDLLHRVKVKPFDVWKHIGNFGSLFPDIPRVLRIHLKEIEAKILMNLMWRDKSTHESCLYFNRLFSLIAHRTYIFCHYLDFPPDACEYIWSVVTHFLAQNLQILKDKSIDRVIIYSVFIIFKVYAKIPLAELIKRYNDIFFLDPELSNSSELESYDGDFENEILNSILNRPLETKAAFPEFLSDERLEIRAKRLIAKEKVGFVAERTKQLWKSINN